MYASDLDAGLVEEGEYIDPNAVAGSGHGGIDYFTVHHFLKALKGEEKPFLDVYRSAALSAVGILGWYSALMDCRELKVPDFTKKEDRDAVREDFRSPFEPMDSKWHIPCRLDQKDKFGGLI